jgi:hypothetical protein
MRFGASGRLGDTQPDTQDAGLAIVREYWSLLSILARETISPGNRDCLIATAPSDPIARWALWSQEEPRRNALRVVRSP